MLINFLSLFIIFQISSHISEHRENTVTRLKADELGVQDITEFNFDPFDQNNLDIQTLHSRVLQNNSKRIFCQP